MHGQWCVSHAELDDSGAPYYALIYRRMVYWLVMQNLIVGDPQTVGARRTEQSVEMHRHVTSGIEISDARRSLFYMQWCAIL